MNFNLRRNKNGYTDQTDRYGKGYSLNTASYAGKRKQRYTKSGLIRGQRPAFKKAYVTVAEGQKIDYYSNI